MRSTLLFTFISCLVLCNTSCVQPEPIAAKKEKKQDELVGKIAALYPEQKYMLIQKYRTFDTEVDAIFYSRNTSGTASQVKMTSQHMGQFYVADIVDGQHAINDPVFMRNLSEEAHNNSEVNGDESDSTVPLSAE